VTFESTLRSLYPGAVTEAQFVEQSISALKPYGFTRETAIACVGVCRDEISQPFTTLVKAAWGEAFVFSSLAGMIFLGRTGFKAAEHHSPVLGGRERYIFFALPHIAIGPQGEPGLCVRTGRSEPSSACGALAAFQKELASGKVSTSLDPDDLEYSLLKQRLLPAIPWGAVPELPELTRRAYDAVLEDITRLASATVNTAHADYAIFTGIQVHGSQATYIWPGHRMVVTNDWKRDL
jgi:hypothetical protein